MPGTLEAIFHKADETAPAIGAPGRDRLTYGRLHGLAGDVRRSLNGFGIGPSDRVAIVLPNGPEMAAAYITVALAAGTAPLNPAYRKEEFASISRTLRQRPSSLPRITMVRLWPRPSSLA